MKAKILFLTLISAALAFGQNGKRILLRCEVLGQQSGNVRYYHPIEGEYQIFQAEIQLQKELKKQLPSFVLVNPFRYLEDSLTMVYGNSLRHYIDPSELVYVNWQMGRDTAKNVEKLDEFKRNAHQIRKEKYDPLVQDYFRPFYMSKYEITNKEYRDFCFWVVDSMMRELIYLNSNPTGEDEIAKKVIAEMLIHPDGYYSENAGSWVDFDVNQPYINRGLYPLNWDFDWKKKIRPAQYVPLISELYLSPNERYYKRREIDTDKISYRYYSYDEVLGDDEQPTGKRIVEHEIKVWTDTNQWIHSKWFPFNDIQAAMYFWHPTYDNYPVVNVSYEQALAFVDWKNCQLRREHPEIWLNYSFHLPNTAEVEWCAKMSTSGPSHGSISDKEVLTNLYLADTLDPYIGFSQQRLKGELNYTEKVFAPEQMKDLKRLKKHLKQQSKTKTGGVYQDIFTSRVKQNHLVSGVSFLSNNVSEWREESYGLNYEKLIEAYINFKCFQNVDYCQYQRYIDQSEIAKNDKNGQLIMGGNWFDERYGTILGVNTKGIFPKRFKQASESFPTVGFRLVLRPN